MSKSRWESWMQWISSLFLSSSPHGQWIKHENWTGSYKTCASVLKDKKKTYLLGFFCALLFFSSFFSFIWLSINMAWEAFCQRVNSTHIILIPPHVNAWCIAFTLGPDTSASRCCPLKQCEIGSRENTATPDDPQTHTQTTQVGRKCNFFFIPVQLHATLKTCAPTGGCKRLKQCLVRELTET